MLIFKAATDGHGAVEMDRHPAPGEPTPAQAESGNYRKRVVAWNGLQIAIENPAGSVRYGNGWQTRMLYDYGYVKRSEGVDGDEVDVYLGPALDWAPSVFVVHQRCYGDWDAYDEDKCMVGFMSADDAAAAYLKHYDDPRFLGPITELSVDEFIAKVKATREAPAMIKSHVSAYTKKDGTHVVAHDRRPMYVSRKVLNGKDIHDWAVAQGFTHVTPPEKMHVTVAYSRAPVHHESVEPDGGGVMADPVGLGILGDDDASVLHIDHPRLQTRFHHMLSLGASWDHEGGKHYKPHVTVSYKRQTVDHTKVQPYTGEIHLGPEKVEDLKSGWGTAVAAGTLAKGQDFGRLSLFMKAHVGAYMRGGKLVNLSGYDGRQARARAAPGQLTLFAAPERKPLPPSPFKGKDPVLDTPDLFSGKTRREEPVTPPAEGVGRSNAQPQPPPEPAPPPAAPAKPHPLHESARKLSEMREKIAAGGDKSGFYAAILPDFEREHRALESAFAAHSKHGDGTELSTKDGKRHAMLLPDASNPGKYRYQMFDERGFSSHSTHDTPEEAVADAARQGFTAHNPGILDKLAGTDEWSHGMAVNAVMQAHNSGQIDWPTAMGKIKNLQAERDAKREKPVDGRVHLRSDLADGTMVRDGKGQTYRVHYQRNGLVLAHPVVDGKPQVSADTTVRFWVDPERSPSGENDRTDPIYPAEAPLTKAWDWLGTEDVHHHQRSIFIVRG